MDTAPSGRLMTAEELAALSGDGTRYELSEGVLICMPPSGGESSFVALNIGSELRAFARRERLGICGGADGGFLLRSGPDVLRFPDAWFVRAERVPLGGIPRGFWPGAPDLAIEVLSPSDRWADVLRKVTEYIEAGTRLVWVIDPETRRAHVFRPDRAPLVVDEHGSLDGEDVLPGFALPLRDALQ